MNDRDENRWMDLVALAIVLAVLAIVCWIMLPAVCAAEQPVQRPPLGICLPCEVMDVVDGDTLTAKVTLTMRVRLLDCWAPETRTRDAAEKALGIESKEALREMAKGHRGRLVIPLDAVDRLDDTISLGRVLAYVWLDDPVGSPDLSTRQIDAGHAWRRKTDLLKALAP